MSECRMSLTGGFPCCREFADLLDFVGLKHEVQVGNGTKCRLILIGPTAEDKKLVQSLIKSEGFHHRISVGVSIR